MEADPMSIDRAQRKRWKAKYEEQFARNDKLRRQLQQLEQHLSELKGSVTASQEQKSYTEVEREAEVAIRLRHVRQRLQTEKALLEWQVRDYDWKLNQESKAIYTAEEDVKELQTMMTETSSLLLEHNLEAEVPPPPNSTRQTDQPNKTS